MPKAYVVACYRDISDQDALERYAELAGPAVKAAGGRILARGGRVQAFEAGLNLRTVVIEFDSFELAVDFYNSDAYQHAVSVLGDAAIRDYRIVEGVE